MTIYSKSVQDTYAAAAKLAATLQGGEIILLDGDLGAGKTTFVKGLALALGVRDMVTSPTFTLFNQYQGDKLKLYHFDLYRLGEGEADELGFDEFIGALDAVTCIEWNRDPQVGKVITVSAKYALDDPNGREYSWQ